MFVVPWTSSLDSKYRVWLICVSYSVALWMLSLPTINSSLKLVTQITSNWWTSLQYNEELFQVSVMRLAFALGQPNQRCHSLVLLHGSKVLLLNVHCKRVKIQHGCITKYLLLSCFVRKVHTLCYIMCKMMYCFDLKCPFAYITVAYVTAGTLWRFSYVVLTYRYCLICFLSQALDGFLFTLCSDGRFLYISETVSIYLGLSQVRSQTPSGRTESYQDLTSREFCYRPCSDDLLLNVCGISDDANQDAVPAVLILEMLSQAHASRSWWVTAEQVHSRPWCAWLGRLYLWDPSCNCVFEPHNNTFSRNDQCFATELLHDAIWKQWLAKLTRTDIQRAI